MGRLGKFYNLKPHVVIDGRNVEHELPTAGDTEGHASGDGRYYVVDLSRMLPPTPPTQKHRCGYLYFQFRPEFMRHCAAKGLPPLSDDAFTRWGRHNAEEHHRDILKVFPPAHSTIYFTSPDRPIGSQRCKQVHAHYVNSTIPEFAHAVFNSAPSASAAPAAAAATPDVKTSVDSKQAKSPAAHSFDASTDLAKLFHSHGINMRYLGFVRSLVHSPQHKQCLLMDMISRAVKIRYRRCLRALVLSWSVSNAFPLAHTFFISCFSLHTVAGRLKPLSSWWRLTCSPTCSPAQLQPTSIGVWRCRWI
jgi:hypothetical protein